ncbi:hypothetical protein N0V86_003209 [Didymella sp. IMI 355093]|nr:hypothetical protein N0V86_003209 [Didymella sp. IMI 355093]
MTVLVVAFMSCRIYSRTVLTKTLGWDDGIMLLAAVSTIDSTTALFAEAADHFCRKQRHGHHIDVAAISNGPPPLPASTYWNIFKYIGRAKCLNIKAIYYFHSGQNTFSDFLIFLWPAKDLLNVKVSLRQRVTLTCMFSLGVM